MVASSASIVWEKKDYGTHRTDENTQGIYHEGQSQDGKRTAQTYISETCF